MATASKTVATRTVLRQVEVEEPAITLTLTPSEAQTPIRIVRCVGGNPYDSRRRHADLIQEALLRVGVVPNDAGSCQGTLKFANEPGFDEPTDS